MKSIVLCDNVIERGKGRKKKKPSMDIKNATIEYDSGAITDALSYWTIIPGTWQEI